MPADSRPGPQQSPANVAGLRRSTATPKSPRTRAAAPTLRRVDIQSDYVVIGTGSAGSVLANRLSADPARQVTVLEAGAHDKDKFVHIPAAFAKLFRSRWTGTT